MIIKSRLSLDQKKIERKKLLSFSLFNGICSACISANILSLYLLHLGFSAALVTVAISFVNIGMIAIICTRLFIRKMGSAGAMSLSWFLKGVSALLLITVPLFFKGYLMIWMVLFIILVFYIFRSIGNPAMEPLFADLTDEDNRGHFSSLSYMNYNIAMLIGFVATYFLLCFLSDYSAFRIILFFGVSANIICSLILSAVKETTYSQDSAKSTIRHTIKEFYHDTKIRRFIITASIALSINSLTVSVSVLALKQVYQVSDSTALIFIIIQTLGSILVSYFSKLISEFTGPMPLINFYLLCTALISVLWFLTPESIMYINLVIIFLLGGITSTGLNTSFFYQFLTVVPQNKSVGYSLIFSIVCGTVGGIVGIIFGGGLLKILILMKLSPMSGFSIFYLIVLIILLPLIIFVSYRNRRSQWSPIKIMKTILSPREMLSLHAINKMEKFATAKQELIDAKELENISSNLSEDMLIYYLNSPHTLVRTKALRGLVNVDLSKKSYRYLITELETGEFTTAYIAAYLLGHFRVKTAVPSLIKTLDSKDYNLKSNSIIALGLLKNYESIERIKQELNTSDIPMVVLACSIALSKLKYNKLSILLMYKILNLTCTIRLSQELLYYIAHSHNFGDNYYKFIRLYQSSKEEGIYYVTDLLKSRSLPYRLFEKCINNEIDDAEIIDFFINMIKQHNNPDLVEYMMVLGNRQNISKDLKKQILYLMFVGIACYKEDKK
ncbi:MAG TPA: MFS transporter [Victivallales bacterium]|nr:MFS transporter [Victivallales bacterium]